MIITCFDHQSQDPVAGCGAAIKHGSGGAVDAGRDAIDDIDERLKGVVTSTDVAAMTWHRRRYMRNIRWREIWMVGGGSD